MALYAIYMRACPADHGYLFVRFAENSQQYLLNYDSTSRKTPNLKQKSQNSGESSLKTFLSGIAFRLLLPRKSREIQNLF